jgi:hypothetical protein
LVGSLSSPSAVAASSPVSPSTFHKCYFIFFSYFQIFYLMSFNYQLF